MAEISRTPPILYYSTTAGDDIDESFTIYTDESMSTPFDFGESTWKAEIRTSKVLDPSGVAPAEFVVDSSEQNVGIIRLTLAKDITNTLGVPLLFSDLERTSPTGNVSTWMSIEIELEGQVST